MADAAHAILLMPSKTCTGRFLLDEEVLRSEGVSDFERYAVNPTQPLVADYFVSDEVLNRLPTKFTRLQLDHA